MTTPITASLPVNLEIPADSSAWTDSRLTPRGARRRANVRSPRSSATAGAFPKERVLPTSHPKTGGAGSAAGLARRWELDGQPAVSTAVVRTRGSASIPHMISRAVSAWLWTWRPARAYHVEKLTSAACFLLQVVAAYCLSRYPPPLAGTAQRSPQLPMLPVCLANASSAAASKGIPLRLIAPAVTLSTRRPHGLTLLAQRLT